MNIVDVKNWYVSLVVRNNRNTQARVKSLTGRKLNENVVAWYAMLALGIVFERWLLIATLIGFVAILYIVLVQHAHLPRSITHKAIICYRLIFILGFFGTMAMIVARF